MLEEGISFKYVSLLVRVDTGVVSGLDMAFFSIIGRYSPNFDEVPAY